jgi:NAD(P)-dependent dehydrogenase (short-subunit alcohol dehydrogenase family)
VPAQPAPRHGQEEIPATTADPTGTILLEIVSEKTGYPAELLGLDMELDADLGIDSIKRVEIFAALQEKIPEAPVIKTEHLGGLRTLRDVVTFLGATAAPSLDTPVAKPEPTVAATSRPNNGRDAQWASRGDSLGGAAHGATTPLAPLRRYVLERVDLDLADGEPLTLSDSGDIWVADDGTGLSSALNTRLALLGHRTRLVGWNDLQSLQCPALLTGLVIVAPPDADDAFLRNAFRLLQLAGPALRRCGKNGGSVFVTVSRLDGAFGLGNLRAEASVLSGGLAGLAKTAAHEWPEVCYKALDLDAAFDGPDTAALAVAREMLQAGPLEVGIAASGRSGLQLTEQSLDAIGPLVIDQGDVVVISGGARGVTAEAAVALGRATRCTLLLLGRSPEPKPEPEWLAPLTAEADVRRVLLAHAGDSLSPRAAAEQYERIRADREMRQTFERVREVGAQVIYRSVDVRDEQAVRSLLAEVRARVGPIRGLVHGAGVLADRRIEDKTLEQFDEVYSTKVQGLQTLLAATESDDLGVLALFSSSSGRFGRTGQVAYAVANEVLNKIAQAQARKRPGCRVVALNWGPWDGGMVTPALKKGFESQGVAVIPLEAGGNHCVAELAATGPAEVVVLGSLSQDGKPANSTPPGLTAAGAAWPSDLPVAFERELNVLELPVLQSHVLAGHTVVPLALIIEWLAHGALHGNPGLAFHGFDDLRLLKGIRLAEGQSYAAKVRAGKAARHGASYLVPVELQGTSPTGHEVLHARVAIVLANRLPAALESAPDLVLPPYPRTRAEIYRDLLFHGPDLQGIERVEGCSEQGILATVAAAAPPANWMRQPLRNTWLAEPLVLDCAFQLLVLWSFEQHGCGSLPAHVGRYRQFCRSFPREGVRVCARLKRNEPHRAVADLWFLDATNNVVAQLDDYECVIDASLNQAFRRNQLLPAATPWPTPLRPQPATEGR